MIKGITERPAAMLTIYIAVYTVVFTLFSLLRYENFYTSNWDLGINMQELWTTTHGKLLWDSADYESAAVVSHLEVHTTYIALLFAIPYELLPSPVFLFTVQSFMISLTTVPLYLISRNYSNDMKKSIAIAFIFPLLFPVIASEMFDYHWMSFIPFYFFSLYYFVMKKRYYSSAALIALGAVTEEVFPFLAASLLLYFFLMDFNLGKKFRDLFSRTNAPLIALGIFSVALYISLNEIQFHLIPVILDNTNAVPYMYEYFQHPLLPDSFHIGKIILGLAYWIVIYASVGFLGVLRLRHLIIAAPWMYYTFFVDPLYLDLGGQYNLIAVLGPFIGLLLYLSTRRVSTSVEKVHKEKGIRGAVRKTTVVGIILILLAVNIAASPIDPAFSGKMLGGGYDFSYGVNPAYHDMGRLVSLIPQGSFIIATTFLFPYVANDVNAFSFLGSTNYTLSSFAGKVEVGNQSLPQFVLYNTYAIQNIPANFLTTMNSDYGVLAEVYMSGYPGNILLLELHYNGAMQFTANA